MFCPQTSRTRSCDVALQTREGELIAKKRAQFGLQSATRLHEAGIASNGATDPPRLDWPSTWEAPFDGAVNTFPGLVHTARHITKVGCTRSRRANVFTRRQTPKVWLMIGVKS